MKEIGGAEMKKLINSGEPVAIFFRMDGCPHCEAMDEPWEELEKEVPHMTFCRIENKKVPADKKQTFNGYPHFEVHGKSKKIADGEMSKDDLKRKLFSSGGTRRRNTGRLTRRKRKTRR